MQLDIHPASEEERLAAYRNVFDFWPQAETLEEHVRRRLASVQHNRAEWFIGCVDGRVATSLACYPLEFCWHGTTVPGMAIGSVHTLADYRGRGFAPQLIRWVEEHQRLAGVKLSVLYSDIDPQYYARLGYVLCPSHEGWADPREAVSRASSDVRLIPCDAGQAHEMSRMLEKRELVIKRSTKYWESLLHQQPGDEFYCMEEDMGYVRLSITNVWKLADFAVMDNDAQRLEQVYRAVIQLAAERGAERVGGWVPNTDASREHFNVQPRTKEITMLKPLDDSIELTDEDIAAADWFGEIDHV